MDIRLKERFMGLWERYFNGAPLPIVFFYTDQEGVAPRVKPPKTGHRCVYADIYKATKGKSLCLDKDSFGCFGGKRYLGYTQEFMPDFEYFLSCGIPGKIEGERYKKSPDLVKKYVEAMPEFNAPSRYIVFKRWDMLEEGDNPDVVIFFGTPDVISGLFTLSSFDIDDLNGVKTPFGAGCATIVLYPYLERNSDKPKAIIGTFDVSARPCIPSNNLSFAVPMNRFVTMIENMEESFLTTGSWSKVLKRIKNEMKKTGK
ncbi:MAG TPA: DUF169 domain-containing protein [Syntrophorhabdaceae bacterium]|nr:DUF169 domain-containing protein [Syntrophorhabdaceae bacterium]